MENKVLNANLNAIKRYDKNLADAILRINNIKSTFELVQNKNQEYNLLFNSIPLHSIDSAKTEAQKIVDKIEELDNKNTIRVIYGLGLGYLADEFITRASGTIIIYEPNIELLRIVFEILEFSENLNKNNVFITNDREKLLKIIDIIADKETKITISFLSSYFNIYKNDIYTFAGFVEQKRGEKQANTNTINKIAPFATFNTLQNLEKITKTPLVSSLKDLYKDSCALIASAGPSLKDNIETIKKYRDNFILFAVGPALKLLEKNGIIPDFLCIVEALDTSTQINDIDLSKTNLIFEPYSSSYLWDLKVKNRFLFFSKENFLNDYLANTLNIDISNNRAIGTVSYCALSSAKIMGFKKIILCGQDLAFKDGQCYAKGSVYEDLECVFNPELNKYEIRAKDYEQYKKKLLAKKYLDGKYADYFAKNYINRLNSTIYSVLGQDGKMLPTQACYAIFIKYFEEFAKNNQNLDLINSSTGGAQIKGFKNLALEQVMLETNEAQKVQIPCQIPQYDQSKIIKIKQEMIKVYTELQEKTAPLENLQNEIIKEFSRRKVQNKTIEKNQQKIILVLNEIVEKYYNLSYVMFLCASNTNRYFENLKQINSNSDIQTYIKLQNTNLYIIKELIQKIKNIKTFLLNE